MNMKRTNVQACVSLALQGPPDLCATVCNYESDLCATNWPPSCWPAFPSFSLSHLPTPAFPQKCSERFDPTASPPQLLWPSLEASDRSLALLRLRMAGCSDNVVQSPLSSPSLAGFPRNASEQPSTAALCTLVLLFLFLCLGLSFTFFLCLSYFLV